MDNPPMHVLGIKSGGTGNNTVITLDGQPLNDVVSLRLEVSFDSFVTATLVLEAALDVEMPAVLAYERAPAPAE